MLSPSPYISSTSGNNKTSRRQPTIGKKTMKNQSSVNGNMNDNIPMYPGTQNFFNESKDIDNSEIDVSNVSENFKETMDASETRAEKINALLNRITGTNSGDGLADYKPVSETKPEPKKYLASDLLPSVSTAENFENNKPIPNMNTYLPSRTGDEGTTIYSNAYNSRILPSDFSSSGSGKPYYASGEKNGTLMEKLNYVAHMLEEMQYEKTSNITEELILYSFLGIFVIFVVDSFSRSSVRYTR